ncbi:MAG TPA: glycosyltransferase, partial [Azospirillum sp.]
MTGDPTPARHRRALLDNPADPLALQHLGLQARDGGGWAHAVRLFTRAAHLHGDRSVLDRQVGGTVAAALNQAAVHLQNAAADKAAACLEPLARILPPDGDFARILGTVRLIQGRDDEARRLHEASQNRAARNEDTGLGVALRGIARHKADYDILGTVVIPVHRMADTIGRALDSVAAAVRFHREASGDPQAQVHICVVDDASPDDTVARALRWAREHPEQSVAVIANNRNRGAGRARNVGAAAAHGRYLWFLDADDYYFERHLFLTASALDRTPDAGFVRTGIHFEGIDQDVTPVWRTASENSYPCNLCVRRACHDLTGGFPEEAPFHPAVADDVAYSRVLHSLFGGLRLAEKTVHYSMGADNALARQRADMTGGATPRDRGPPDARFMAIEILTQRRLHALNAKRALIARTGGWSGPPLLTPDTPPPPPGDAATWIARGKEAIGAGQPDRALARFTRAASLEPGNATAWFELGLAANSLQRFDLVSRAFRAVVRILPEAAAARFNLGSMLFDRGACAPAASSLRLALALQPDHVNSLFLLGRTVRRLGRTATAAALLARGVRLDPARPELDAEYADTALELGDAVRAARHARRALLSNPALYDGHAALAGALEILNRPGEALVAWERAIVCNPGRGEGFTRRAVNLLARRWGPPPVP